MDKTERSDEKTTEDKNREDMRKAVPAVVLVCSPLVMFGVFETITENLFKLNPESVVWNLIFYSVIYFAVLGITHSERGSFTFLNVFFTVWAIAEYFVVSFRQRPIMIFDVTAFRTAMTVAGNYDYIPTVRMVCGVVFIIIWTVLIWRFTVKIKTGVRGWVLSAAASVAACIITPALFLGIGMYLEHFYVDMWEPIHSFETEGTLVSTICSFFYLGNEEPEGYSLARVAEIKDKIEAWKDDEELVFGTESSIVPTNIICIMNESFSDLRRVGDFETDVEFMPFLDSLTENCIKGDLFVPVFGSMTCNTEWEFLTGNSMTFVPDGSVPFQTYMKTPSYSIVSILKDEGYRTVAMHPNPGYNWNRNGAYSALGFDEFYDINDFPEDAPVVRELIADQADYEKIIDLVESKEEGQPLFIFDVTLQNHGGYTENWESTVHLAEYDDFPQTEQYLSLIKISDEEFEFLIDYFENIDEPTLIVMFGDHQPSVEEEFYEELYGGPLSEFPYAQLVRRYITPFIIWTNYPTESADDIIMSPMYLGMAALERANISLTDYLYFENELYKHAPVIHFYGYKQSDGSLIDWSRYKTRPEWEYLDAYKILHYNNVFDSSRDDSIYKNQ